MHGVFRVQSLASPGKTHHAGCFPPWPGYFNREAPAEILACPAALSRHLVIKNRADEPGLAATAQVGVDFLQLVRLGLRRADDPLILDSLKLAASHALGRVFDRPEAVWRRYVGSDVGSDAGSDANNRPEAATWVWTPIAHLAAGRALLILLPRPATLHLGFDGWQDIRDLPSQPLAHI